MYIGTCKVDGTILILSIDDQTKQPTITHKGTGNVWTLGWAEMSDMALTAGVAAPAAADAPASIH